MISVKKDSTRERRVSLRLSPSEYEPLCFIAKKEGVSLSCAIRSLLKASVYSFISEKETALKKGKK